MSASTLGSLFAPATVGIIGATDDLNRASGRLVRYMTGFGYAGDLYLVNPNRSEVAGLTCVPTIGELPRGLDLVLISLPASAVPQAIEELGGREAKAIVVFAAGFSEDTAAGGDLEERLNMAAKDSGARILGPNTGGVRNASLAVFAEQGTRLTSDSESGGFTLGTIGLITQSGGVGGYFGSTYLRRVGAGSKYVVDTGNELDIDAADCLDYMSGDAEITAIAMILENCRDGRKLAAAVRRARDRGKAVLFLGVGRTAPGMAAAQSHTSAMASRTALLEAELEAAGAVVTRDERVLADLMVLHDVGCVPQGPGLGIVTQSGGFAIMAVDLAIEQGLAVPALDYDAGTELLTELGLTSGNNPLDLSGVYRPGTEALEKCLEYVAGSPEIDMVLFWEPHRLLREDQQARYLEILRTSRVRSGKPHFHCGMVPPDYAARLRSAGLLSVETPSRLVAALSAATVDRSRRLERARVLNADKSAMHRQADAGRPLPTVEARALVAAAGIDCGATDVIGNAEQAQQAIERWGRPIMMKLESRLATHKSEHGFVVGPLEGGSVRAAFERLDTARAALGDVEAQIVVQPYEAGISLALGAQFDPQFGPTVMVAEGGVAIEVTADAVFAAAPVDRERASQMIAQLAIYPILAGARGTVFDLPAVVDALVALSELISKEESPRLSIDLNPIIVKERDRGVVAVDVRVIAETPNLQIT